MTLQDEMDAEMDRIVALRALRPQKWKTDRPRCRLCSAGLQEADAGEFECEPCREKASRRVMAAEARRRVWVNDLLVDW